MVNMQLFLLVVLPVFLLPVLATQTLLLTREELHSIGRQFQAVMAMNDHTGHLNAAKTAGRFESDVLRQRVSRQEIISEWRRRTMSQARFVDGMSPKNLGLLARQYSNKGLLYMPTFGERGRVKFVTWVLPYAPLLADQSNDYCYAQPNIIEMSFLELATYYQFSANTEHLTNIAVAELLSGIFSKACFESLAVSIALHPPKRKRMLLTLYKCAAFSLFALNPMRLNVEQDLPCTRLEIKEEFTVSGFKWDPYVFARFLLSYIFEYSAHTGTNALANIKQVFPQSSVIVLKTPFVLSHLGRSPTFELGSILDERPFGYIFNFSPGEHPIYSTAIYGEPGDILIGTAKVDYYKQNEPHAALLRNYTAYSVETVGRFSKEFQPTFCYPITDPSGEAELHFLSTFMQRFYLSQTFPNVFERVPLTDLA